MSTSLKPRPFFGTLEDLRRNREYLLSLGVDPAAQDDTQFPTAEVYCAQHRRVHVTGWCTVPNAQKLPVNEDLPLQYRP